MTSPPIAEPKSYQWSSSTQKEVGFLAPGLSGETVRPPFLTWMPCRDRYSVHESLDLIFCIMGFIVTSYRTAVRCCCMKLTSLTAEITYVVAQRAFYLWVWTLHDLKFPESTSTPRAHMSCIIIRHDGIICCKRRSAPGCLCWRASVHACRRRRTTHNRRVPGIRSDRCSWGPAHRKSQARKV